MKIAILGATGQTGRHLVQQALDENHDVIAIVRTASKLINVHEKLTVVEGNIFSEEDFQDVDAVMSTLGFEVGVVSKRTVTGYSDITKCAVKALRESPCKRLILLHGWHSYEDAMFLVRWIVMPFLRPLFVNMKEAEEYLDVECGDINYTVVCAPILSDNPKTELEYEVVENGSCVPGASINISRADVARYMIKVAQDKNSYQKIHAIALKP